MNGRRRQSSATDAATVKVALGREGGVQEEDITIVWYPIFLHSMILYFYYMLCHIIL